MPIELPKQYDPKEAQQKWLAFWNEHGYFHSKPDGRQPFTIVIPPPNVTGALHMGHALNNTLQDVLIRWRRMQGYNALYMPGTDHAGIATQAVVERLIFQQEKTLATTSAARRWCSASGSGRTNMKHASSANCASWDVAAIGPGRASRSIPSAPGPFVSSFSRCSVTG